MPPLRQGSVAQSFTFVSHKSPVNPIQEINEENIVIIEFMTIFMFITIFMEMKIRFESNKENDEK